jgi:hypothetical protein
MSKADHGATVANEHNLKRSSHWPAVEKAHLAKEPECRCCPKGKGYAVQVHHQFPFHFAILLGRPDLETDDRNLITLCESEEGKPAPNHHLLIGHLDSFQSSNLDVYEDATKTFHGWDADRIKASPKWQDKVAKRLKTWNEMTDADKHQLRKLMDERFPSK